MAKLSQLPSVDLSADLTGITIATSGPGPDASAAVHLPIEFLPGIILLLQSELNRINKGHYRTDDAIEPAHEPVAETRERWGQPCRDLP
ncbi:MAG: hypothetical protein V4671_06030 [Armatimonadota bacterium]